MGLRQFQIVIASERKWEPTDSPQRKKQVRIFPSHSLKTTPESGSSAKDGHDTTR